MKLIYCLNVRWTDSLSDNISIGNGVRQGAVLSPLLLTLYIYIYIYIYSVYNVT